MFRLLNNSPGYVLQPDPVMQVDPSDSQKNTNSLNHNYHKGLVQQHRRSTSSLSHAGGKIFSHVTYKSPSQFLEKFIRSELSGYNTKKCQTGNSKLSASQNCPSPHATSNALYSNILTTDWEGFNCLQGIYRIHDNEKFYESVQVKQQFSRNTRKSVSGNEVQRSISDSCSFGVIGSGLDGVTLSAVTTLERLQRRRLLHTIFIYDQQNRLLHRELAKEKRRRTEELTCVVKSLLLCEAKLKNDMKAAGQRMLDRDAEICRLIRLNRVMRMQLDGQLRDEDMEAEQDPNGDECLVLEALQCKNCRRKFYDIEPSDSSTQTLSKELIVLDKADPASSSDDTVSSSFHEARRSLRYTSKRTGGTFRDYMRSRVMGIEHTALEQHSEENTSTISREDSQTSNEHICFKDLGRMREVESETEEDCSEQSNFEVDHHQQGRRHITSRHRSCKTTAYTAQKVDDVFSPTQDYDKLKPEQKQRMIARGVIKIVQKRCADFSEASPKQIYETTTDDWYASASDQEEPTVTSKPYGQGAVNPVLECVNQILLQQSMEDSLREPMGKSALASDFNSFSGSRVQRRNSLNGRSVLHGRKRVHFSTKNSMVHVPRLDDEKQRDRQRHSLSENQVEVADMNASNYESIFSNDYEPIGSELAFNPYVYMGATVVPDREHLASDVASKFRSKLAPALPPKPANLLKFKNSLKQLKNHLRNHPDCCNSTTTASEPDYCSISEVGVNTVRVQVMADVHHAPKSTTPPLVDRNALIGKTPENSTPNTEEIEEILADIPKLPNVAAIIISKHTSPVYLKMTPRTMQGPHVAPQSPQLTAYKGKHEPNVLAEINNRLILPSSPTLTTPTRLPSKSMSKSTICTLGDASSGMPIQAEFDWYNLDVEYNAIQSPTTDNDFMNNSADEYNLDEEFQQEEPEIKIPESQLQSKSETQVKKNLASL
ncbi:hypothetical protein KR009_000610 [Drosophila setifemur]|nr:hypothetical protein KR009_000610 [Drosophila setifemur]